MSETDNDNETVTKSMLLESELRLRQLIIDQGTAFAGDMKAIRTDFTEEMKEVHGEIHKLRSELVDKIHHVEISLTNKIISLTNRLIGMSGGLVLTLIAAVAANYFLTR